MDKINKLCEQLQSLGMDAIEARMMVHYLGEALRRPPIDYPIDRSQIFGTTANLMIIDDYMPIEPDSLMALMEENRRMICEMFNYGSYINHPDGWYRKFDKANGKRNLRSK